MDHKLTKTDVCKEESDVDVRFVGAASDSQARNSFLLSFAKRLREAIGQESFRRFGHRAGVTDGAINHYLNRGSEPSLTRLVDIARAANVNLLWLATGEGPMRGGQVAEETAPYAAGAALDQALLTAIIETVVQEAPHKSPAWQAKMAVALYDLGDIPKEKRVALVRAAL